MIYYLYSEAEEFTATSSVGRVPTLLIDGIPVVYTSIRDTPTAENFPDARVIAEFPDDAPPAHELHGHIITNEAVWEKRINPPKRREENVHYLFRGFGPRRYGW